MLKLLLVTLNRNYLDSLGDLMRTDKTKFPLGNARLN